MRSQIVLIIMLMLVFLGCDQAPTTLDEEPYKPSDEAIVLSVDIVNFDFDILNWDFFFAVAATSPEESIVVSAELSVTGNSMATFILEDSGVGSDILVNDGFYDGTWSLPDSMSAYIDTLWTLHVTALSAGETQTDSLSFQPEQPSAPNIIHISHMDTLVRPATGQIRDTIMVEIFHPGGRDSVRDVSLISRKPDSTYANSGSPIPLYDDGGTRPYSGDSIAGDGIYSLILPLESHHLTGTYRWTFSARTWLGIEATPVEDSLIVIESDVLLKGTPGIESLSGVFQ